MKSNWLPVTGVIVALLAGCFLGCGVKKRQTGDLASFLASELCRYGARAKGPAVPAKLQASWTIRRDANGFECVAYGVTFEDVHKTIAQILGSEGELHSSDAGLPCSWFRASVVGVAVLVRSSGGKVKINCVRPFSQWVNPGASAPGRKP